MFSQLLYLLLFESVQPSYIAMTSVLPSKIAVAAEAPSLEQKKAPVKVGESVAPVLQAQSIYAVDINTGTPLFTRDIFTRRQIASISKLVTAMVILDNHKPDEMVTVSKNAAEQEGSKMWLRSGERISIEHLLQGMLMNSGNDAAVALAEFDSGTETAFVVKMNEKAYRLDLRDTHFTNAKGFDQRENYSTAFDTMRFGRAALDYPLIKKFAATKRAEIVSASGIRHTLESTNELLQNEYFDVVGLKTGHTPASGESFVSLLEGPAGHEILTVVLNSPDRFKETRILIDWLLRNYEFR